MKKIYFILLSIVVALAGFQTVAFAQTITVEPDEQVLEDLIQYNNSASPAPEGISYNKIISQPNTQGVYNIFLQAFVTGEKTSVQKSIPSDIVLVLDVSNSMITNNVTSYTYSENGTASTERSYDNANGLYIEYPEGSENYYPITRERTGSQGNRRYHLYFTVSGTRYYLTADGIVQATSDPTDGATSQNETVWTGQLYTRTTNTMTRLDALKEAVGEFLDTIHKDDIKDPSNPLGHKVSIVKFSGPYVGGSADAAMTPGNHQGGTNVASTEVFKDWTSMTDNSVVETLKSDVNSINTGTGTAIDYGMVLAQKLLGTSTPSTTDNPRSKTVVVFTDGAPSHYGMGDGMDEGAIADAAISTANEIKQVLAYTTTVDGVSNNVYTKIYTVGMLGSNPSGTAKQVLERSSSNYEGATSRTSGNEVSTAYYFLAEDAESLKAAFASIGASSGGASYTMDSSTTATVDVISKSFMLPKNADVNSISVWTADCIGEYLSGEYKGLLKFSDEWDDGRAQGLQVALSADKTEVTVTNFNYSENWCGSETSATGLKTYRGKKLILGIPIQMATSAVGGKDLNTNAEGSGIIVNGENILPFNNPHVSLPVNIWIRKEGLEEGESARFIIQRAVKPSTWPEPDSEDYPEDSKDSRYNSLSWEDVSSVFVTRHKNQAKTGENAPVTKAIGLPSVNESNVEFIYRVVEDNGWSWSYTPGATSIFTSDQLVTNPFVFSNTKKTDIDVTVRHAESKATNTFKDGDFVVDGTVVKVVNENHVSYDDSKANTGTGRTTTGTGK